MASPGLLVERVDCGGGGRPGEGRSEGFWKTVDIHGTDGSTVIIIVVVVVVTVGIVSVIVVAVAAAAVPPPAGRVVERVSPLRLLAGPHRLPLPLRGDSGGSETHRGQTGAGAPVIP